MRSTSTPSWTTKAFPAATPSSISMRRIASDAQRKRSTRRYFHLDSGLRRT